VATRPISVANEVSDHALRVILHLFEEHTALVIELFTLITTLYSWFPHPSVLWLVMLLLVLLQILFWAPHGRLGLPYDLVLLVLD
jgi:hypothetical protein